MARVTLGFFGPVSFAVTVTVYASCAIVAQIVSIRVRGKSHRVARVTGCGVSLSAFLLAILAQVLLPARLSGVSSVCSWATPVAFTGFMILCHVVGEVLWRRFRGRPNPPAAVGPTRRPSGPSWHNESGRWRA
ncbi:hypothetical protein [Nonomuraea jabiensis]|uniref:hypothetical protein n=1 Tax=Nonomuraea jabiensis TaxID=882448 RepID=UPI003D74F738